MENFRAELITARQQLRDVRHALRKDIEALTTWVKIINIWAMPVLISIAALAIAIVRRRRYRQRLAFT